MITLTDKILSDVIIGTKPYLNLDMLRFSKKIEYLPGVIGI